MVKGDKDMASSRKEIDKEVQERRRRIMERREREMTTCISFRCPLFWCADILLDNYSLLNIINYGDLFPIIDNIFLLFILYLSIKDNIEALIVCFIHICIRGNLNYTIQFLPVGINTFYKNSNFFIYFGV